MFTFLLAKPGVLRVWKRRDDTVFSETHCNAAISRVVIDLNEFRSPQKFEGEAGAQNHTDSCFQCL